MTINDIVCDQALTAQRILRAGLKTGNRANSPEFVCTAVQSLP
ncbi:hypothetical protein [Methylomonas albis]|nr:hypothetical protein [Methylomonas albis]